MKKLGINTLVLLSTTALLVLVSEIGIRLSGWHEDNPYFFQDTTRNTSAFYQDIFKMTRARQISDKSFNIYYFGGSSMVGVPYEPEITIPRLVQFALGSEIQGKTIRSINLAEPSKGLDFAFKRLEVVLARKEVFHPSLAVIYSGHNEFIRFQNQSPSAFIRWFQNHSFLVRFVRSRYRDYPLTMDERSFFDVLAVSDTERKEALNHYEKTLKRIARLLQKHDIPLILSTVASNTADWEPNRSVYRGNKEEKLKFKSLMDSGLSFEKTHDFSNAVLQYQSALKIDPGFAEAHYRLGKSFKALNQNGKAWQSFLKALETDELPMRTLQSQNKAILAISDTTNAHGVDAVRYLRGKAPDKLIGFNFMSDMHHANFKGYLLISEAIASEITEVFETSGEKSATLSEKEIISAFNFDSKKLYRARNRSGRWAYKNATMRYDPAERLAYAERIFRQGVSLLPSHHESYIGLAMVHYLRKDLKNADYYIREAMKRNGHETRIYLHYDWVLRVIERARENA